MTGWLAVAVMGALTAATTVLAVRRDNRLRRHAAETQAMEAARERVRAEVARIVERGFVDSFGVRKCLRCGGVLCIPSTKAHGKGDPGRTCRCGLAEAA